MSPGSQQPGPRSRAGSAPVDVAVATCSSRYNARAGRHGMAPARLQGSRGTFAQAHLYLAPGAWARGGVPTGRLPRTDAAEQALRQGAAKVREFGGEAMLSV